MALEPWQWALAALSAFILGLSKTGIAGLGILGIALFALVFKVKASVGIVLPILISSDIVAVSAYRRHAEWPHLWRLFPWAGAGVVCGSVAMGRINDTQIAHLMGAILVVMVSLQLGRRAWARRRGEPDSDPFGQSRAGRFTFAAVVGILAGFTTMVANAAGPILVLYLLSMRLPKMAFIGTSAWFFLSLNLFKVPFSVGLGLINARSLLLCALLLPFSLGGALFGRALLPRINQSLFETLALVFTLLAALRLLL